MTKDSTRTDMEDNRELSTTRKVILDTKGLTKAATLSIMVPIIRAKAMAFKIISTNNQNIISRMLIPLLRNSYHFKKTFTWSTKMLETAVIKTTNSLLVVIISKRRERTVQDQCRISRNLAFHNILRSSFRRIPISLGQQLFKVKRGRPYYKVEI